MKRIESLLACMLLLMLAVAGAARSEGTATQPSPQDPSEAAATTAPAEGETDDQSPADGGPPLPYLEGETPATLPGEEDPFADAPPAEDVDFDSLFADPNDANEEGPPPLPPVPPLPGPRTRPAVRSADLTAADALRRDAEALMFAAPDTIARAGRVLALSLFSQSLDPENPQTLRMLADIHESRGRFDQAAAALAGYLKICPEDYLQQVGRIRLEIDQLQSARERIEALGGFAADANLASAVRAEAQVMRAELFLGVGDRPGARQAYQAALELDPYHPEAINGGLALSEDVTRSRRVKALIQTLRGDPTNLEAISRIAGILGEEGLYEEAIEFCEMGLSASQLGSHSLSAQHAMALRLLNAMLDARQYEQAIERFKPLRDRFRDSMDLNLLILEAYRLSGQEFPARKLAKAFEDSFEQKIAATTVSPTFARELAWFYLMTVPRPSLALKYARQAAQFDGSDPIVQRMLGMAELASGRTEKGLRLLKPLVGKDIYAGVALAVYYLQANQDAKADEVMLESVKISRTGPGFRALRRVIDRAEVELPEPRHREEVLEAIEGFPPALADLVETPENFIHVALQPESIEVVVGQPIRVRAVLFSTAEIPVPVGTRGLFQPRLALKVAAEADDGTQTLFSDLPILEFPAPRYLQPGEPVVCTGALDVGALRQYLVERPLQDVTLEVYPVLDPVQTWRGIAAGMELRPRPVEPILRERLLGDYDAGEEDPESEQARQALVAAYSRMLGEIVYRMKQGDFTDRIHAARQVASLIAWLRSVDEGRNAPPEGLLNHLQEPVVLRMFSELLKDRSDVVRAEAVAGLLRCTSFKSRIIALLGPVIEDPSSLVRFRVAEVVGATDLSGSDTLLDLLAQDSDPLVRLMVTAFLVDNR